MLNMSVLIATGVLAAYLFSVLITFLGGEIFYEAAAMLVTFVLFGHWMEMRSRRGTNESKGSLDRQVRDSRLRRSIRHRQPDAIHMKSV
jgi:cation transport ATPase